MTSASGFLITGANGLLGRAVLRRLEGKPNVAALVREAPEAGLPGQAAPVIQDLSKPFDFNLPQVPETVVHLAQSSRFREFPDAALDVFEVNIGSTQRLLDWACHNGVKRLIFASTGGVYGNSDTPFTEDSPLSNRSDLGHYIASKRCGELLCEAYGREMIIVILRFFFIYGPEQRRSMLMPRLVDNVSAGRPLTLQGHSGIKLNPIHVEDAASAVLAANQLEEGTTINVAGPDVVSLREIGELIGSAVGEPARFEVNEEARPRHLIADIARMRQLLGSPTTSMADGMATMAGLRRSAGGLG